MQIESLENKLLYKIGIYVVFAVLLIIVISNKASFSIDEVYSYGLANHSYTDTIKMSPIEGKIYIPAEEAYLEYMSVQAEERFSYGNVWKNQSVDVHPPLYYFLLHTISSFFPQSFSIWYAGSINISFAVLTLWVMRKLVWELSEDRKIKVFFSVAFITTAGLLNVFSFFRMYVAAMFWVTIMTYLFVIRVKFSEFSENFRGGWKWYPAVCICSVCGALTHYYFIVYLFFLSAVMCGWYIYNKCWKQLLIFVTTMLTAGGIAICIFPSMLIHIFGLKKHSQTAMENLMHESVIDFAKRLMSLFSSTSKYLFGVKTGLLIVIFLSVLLAVKNIWRLDKGERFWCWLLLIMPSACYYILIARIATYVASRYLHPIYAIVFILGFYALWYAIKTLTGSKYQWKVFGSITLALIVYGWITCSWAFLNTSGSESVKVAETYSDKECIFVYPAGKGQFLHASFFEIKKYEQITFITEENLELFKELPARDKTELIVYITTNCDEDAVLRELLNDCSFLKEYEEISRYGTARAFYLY